MSADPRRITLLFNPVSGRQHSGRLHILERLALQAQDAGAFVEVIPTAAPGSGGQQAAEACARGADIVFACGGDGTVHDVLQGMVFQKRAALGVVPLGSANVLARHLELPTDPVSALLLQLRRSSRVIPIGQLTFTTPSGECTRFFSVMAGAGPDGALVYRTLATSKQRFGRWSYYLRALHLIVSSRFSPFTLRLQSATGSSESAEAVSAMTVRVGDLGGAFSPLMRGASLEDSDLLLARVSAPASVSFPMWFATNCMGRKVSERSVSMHRVQSFDCDCGEDGAAVQVQADGEWLGRTPMSVKLVPNALRLLVAETR